MNYKQMSLGPLGTNCYIVYEKDLALIVDPGGNQETIAHFLHEKNLTPKAILLTHAHFDHIGAVDALRKQYNLKVYLHEEESTWLSDPTLNRSSFFMGESIITDAPDHFLIQGNMNLGIFSFNVIHTPGHSPGSVSFIFTEDEVIISGDVLFQHGIGRTDLPGGNFEQLEDSIKNNLYKLPNSFTVLPGHGPSTTIGEEKKNNPFVPEE